MKIKRNLTAIGLAAVAAVVLIVATAGAQSKITLKSESASSLGGTVLAAPSGRTLYRLSPETSTHLLCTSSACLGVWKPLTVKSKSTTVKLPSGAKGHAAFVKRGKAFQVTLGGKPLYTFAGDTATGQATGDGIKSFGGTWHAMSIAKAASAPAPAPSTPAPGGY
jgi:predicted lipoprotein with Yx(FWY)xxD motif